MLAAAAAAERSVVDDAVPCHLQQHQRPFERISPVAAIEVPRACCALTQKALDGRWQEDWMACLSLFLETDGFTHLLAGFVAGGLPSLQPLYTADAS